MKLQKLSYVAFILNGMFSPEYPNQAMIRDETTIIIHESIYVLKGSGWLGPLAKPLNLLRKPRLQQ